MTDREYWRAKSANWRADNRERHCATKRAWYARNADQINARRRASRLTPSPTPDRNA